MRAERAETHVVEIAGKNATFKVPAVTDEDGEIWMSFDYLINMLEADCKCAGTLAPASAKHQLEREMGQDEAKIFEVQFNSDVFKPRKFVNEVGVVRCCSLYPASEAGKASREFYVRLHKEYLARRKSLVPSDDRHTYPTEERLVAIGSRAVAEVIGPLLQNHNARLDIIEDSIPILRDPTEFITAREALIEDGRDPSMIVPPTRQNLEEWVGRKMSDKGHEKGPTRTIRLGGTSRIIEANTYKRGEIYEVIKLAFEQCEARLVNPQNHQRH